MNKTTLYSLFCATALMLLPGCIPNYTSHSFKSLVKAVPFQEDREDVELRVQRLRAKDIAQLFDGRGSRLFRRTKLIYPIQISITNNSGCAWSIDPESISLDHIEHEQVAHYFYTSTGLSTLLSTLGLTASGVALFGCIVTDFFTHGALTQSVVGPLFLSSIGNGIFWASYRSLMYFHADKTNKIIAKDLAHKMLTKQLIIWPNQTVECLIFVKKKNFCSPFTITLHDPRYYQKPMVFEVALNMQ